MILTGLHLLLTYQCTFECDHCFVFGSAWQTGTMTIATIQEILKQSKKAGSVEWIYFEGGEPFLYYQTMLAGINEAIKSGFKVGIVTNSYWATSDEDALLWLKPLAGKVQDLTISSDLFHFTEKESQQSKIVNPIEPLSQRELEILRLFKTELSGPEIAEELVIALSTVRTHTKSIFSKLNVNNRRAAVKRAAELGLM